MLVLQRSIGERIILTVPASTVEREIVVSLEDVRSSQRARIGFEAAKDVTILREEIATAATPSSAETRAAFQESVKR